MKNDVEKIKRFQAVAAMAGFALLLIGIAVLLLVRCS